MESVKKRRLLAGRRGTATAKEDVLRCGGSEPYPEPPSETAASLQQLPRPSFERTAGNKVRKPF